MASGLKALPRSLESIPFLKRFSFPRPLAWGYLGLLLFMVGDGVESGYLAHFLLSNGMHQGEVAAMFALYGIAAATAARFSGVLSDLWGPRMVMQLGLAFWSVFQVLFLLFGIPTGNFFLLAGFYSLRGFGYPLFAYGFLVWIAAATPHKRLGSAVGWFWFSFTAGLPTLGALLASLLIPFIGQYATFWSSLAFVLIGGIVTLVGVSESTGFRRLLPSGMRPIDSFIAGLAIAWKKPQVVVGCIIRMINTAPQFGFLVFLPTFFTKTIGFSLGGWLRLLSYMFLSNIIWNLIMGAFGDKLGWRRTVAYAGGLGCTIATLLLYYVPSIFPGQYMLAVLVAVLYGATLAGYVPLSAIMPCLAPENKGAAISMLNLGAAASAWLGPTIVGVFIGPLGVVGVIWIFAVLHFVSAILALFLKLPAHIEEVAGGCSDGLVMHSGAAFAASGCLLGHTPTMVDLEEENEIDLILFDLGGTIYDDETYTRALLRAVRQLNPTVREEDFWALYDTERGRSSGSLRTAVANHFLPGRDRDELVKLARQYWEYPASSLYPDVKPTLSALARKFKLGLVANSGNVALNALRRDGLRNFFEVIVLSEVVGIEKPDERIFQYALEKTKIPPSRAVLVGNRLDNDIRPSKRLGLRTIWLLRGDAPPAPLLEQLSEPDAVIISLIGLPIALSRLMKVRQI
ncbi:MAG: MFS transporter [Verrucomicrobia bacterium]|nr:MFS transporter [Verrucomicrobiota bacterium]